jgi:16S rRNA processing protein RimM
MMKKQPEPDFIAVGRILRPHGVRGEVRVELFTDFPERWSGLESVFLGEQHLPQKILRHRLHKNYVLVKFAGYDDRNEVESLRGDYIYVSLADAIPLESDEFYYFQVIGLEVQTESGEVLGEIVDVLKPPGANEVFVVYGFRGELLIPVIEDVIKQIDLDAGHVIIRPLPGLFDDD